MIILQGMVFVFIGCISFSYFVLFGGGSLVGVGGWVIGRLWDTVRGRVLAYLLSDYDSILRFFLFGLGDLC